MGKSAALAAALAVASAAVTAGNGAKRAEIATNTAEIATNAAEVAALSWETPEIRAARLKYEAAMREADAALAELKPLVERYEAERRRLGPYRHYIPKFKTEDERREYEIRQRAEILDALRRVGREAEAARRVRTSP